MQIQYYLLIVHSFPLFQRVKDLKMATSSTSELKVTPPDEGDSGDVLSAGVTVSTYR